MASRVIHNAHPRDTHRSLSLSLSLFCLCSLSRGSIESAIVYACTSVWDAHAHRNGLQVRPQGLSGMRVRRRRRRGVRLFSTRERERERERLYFHARACSGAQECSAWFMREDRERGDRRGDGFLGLVVVQRLLCRLIC